jgi:hypothetical protein
MKKFVFLFALIFAFAINSTLMAQPEQVDFEARLETVFELTIVNGSEQIAWFNDANDYNNGVTASPGNQDGIDPGTTDVTMEATGNWQLLISAPDLVEGTTADVIPIANVGVYVEATGNHTIGAEVTSLYIVGNPNGLETTDEILIDNGTGNNGTALDNSFTLHWEMGTMAGTMNGQSMLEQMANGDFGPGIYNTIIDLTLNPI